MNYLYLDTPIGQLRLLSDGQHITAIEFEGGHSDSANDQRLDDPALSACARQLGEYFAGERKRFELPLAPAGTAFQNSVWNALRQIPYGELRSYRDIASSINNTRAVRAVGAANGRNPIPIVVPCHRVIGSDGSLTGFAGGLAVKETLLRLEGAID